MDRPLTRNDLKVDSTILTQTNDYWLILFNVNVPARLVTAANDNTNPQLLYNACTQIINFVNSFVEHNQNEQVVFQITACYYIVNTKTGLQRLWTGSFSPRANFAAQLAQFQNFNARTFSNVVTRSCENFDVKLTWIGRDTVWKFDSLESIIVNIQSPIKIAIGSIHPILQRYGLVAENGDYFKRRIITFELP